MTDSLTASDESPTVSTDAQIVRLERRLKRERNARRQAEEISERGMRELWLANKELDQRVEERTVHLAEALEQLRIASSSRDRFLGTLSHEIRTPLNGVLGMFELIGSHISGEQGQSYLKVASESADRLEQLISRLLDLVELDSGSMTTSRSTVDVAQLSDRIRMRWQHVALRSGHLLTVSHLGSESTTIDEARVEQILHELIDNALTHAGPGAIRVELSSTSEEFIATVTDSGPGIAPELIDGLLTDFSMIDDSTARAAQGLGLGLALCRRIAEAIGGTLTIESDGKTSSSASLSLPTNIDY